VDVKQLNISKIQNGVFYCPDHQFYTYDIQYCYEDDVWHFVNYNVCMEMFKTCGFQYAIPLAVGLFNDVISYNPVFQTMIPRMFGLPEVDGNMAEGVVIKPIESINLPNGSRVIFKNKNNKFSETNDAIEIVINDVPEHIQQIQHDMLTMVTFNRLDNVISKIGNIDQSQSSKLIGLLAKDVIEEFNKIHEDQLASLEKNDKALVTQYFNKN
jgi:Rnl2 family RNA ligase